LLEYGERDAAAVETAIAAAAAAGPPTPELEVARAALAVARLPVAPDTPALAAARAEVDRARADGGTRGLAGWLEGLVLVAGGERAGARTALTEAARGGPVQAQLALGDLELDGGDLEAALAAYDAALARAPAHPRALVGRALLHLERREAAAADL